MERRLLSVIIPMYNAEKFIASMIKAIQNQSYTNFEVIIVDDQSTDNSVEVVKKMVSYDSRFHLFVRPNLVMVFTTDYYSIFYR